MHIKLKMISIMFLLLFVFYNPAHATVYFYFDAENGTDGAELSNPPFCQTQCTSAYDRGTYQSSGGAPQGSKYFQWQTINNQPEAYTVIGNVGQNPPLVSNALGNTYYVAYYFNFTRINGLDIWHETGQSADKGVKIVGSGIRWVLGRGNWATLANNQDHRFTVFIGNPSYHLNPLLEHGDIYWPNQNGYTNTNTLQLQYEQWHSAVMAVRIASDNTGSVAFWIDGIKIGEYNNIRTAGNSSPTISHMVMGGTIAQGAYDAPAHYRKFDALMLTDNWQDIIDGGYVNGGDTQAPSVPTGLSAQVISSSQINLTWTASTDDVGVTGYRIYRDSVEIATSTTTSYSNTGLSPSTTYSYTVSAYDATGNNSAQSSSASATTSGGGGGSAGNDSAASGGSGCGFVKDSSNSNKVSESQSVRVTDIGLMIMLIATLAGIAIARRIVNGKLNN